MPPARKPRARKAPPPPSSEQLRSETRQALLEEMRRRVADPAARASMTGRELTTMLDTLNRGFDPAPPTLPMSDAGAAFLRALRAYPTDAGE